MIFAKIVGAIKIIITTANGLIFRKVLICKIKIKVFEFCGINNNKY